MSTRSLAFGALACLVVFSASVANAATLLNTVSGITYVGKDGPTTDQTTLLGGSFTDSTPSLALNITLDLAAMNTQDGGSALVYLVPDNGGGGGVGLPGTPTILNNPSSVNGNSAFTGFTGADQLVGTVADSSLNLDAQTFVNFWVQPSITTTNQEYWVVLAPSDNSSAAWYYEADASGIGASNQDYFNNCCSNSNVNLASLPDSSGAYMLIVSTPEPTTLAILGGAMACIGYFRRRQARLD